MPLIKYWLNSEFLKESLKNDINHIWNAIVLYIYFLFNCLFSNYKIINDINHLRPYGKLERLILFCH